MADSLVLYEPRDRAVVLTLNRPAKLNAMNGELIAQLQAALRRADDDPAVRAIIVTGAGEAFSGGMDLHELAATTEPSANLANPAARHGPLAAEDLLDETYRLSTPTIAAVNGIAVAGGSGMTCVCDLAIAAREARFGFPQVRLGIVASVVIPHILRIVGERAARQLLLTGELIDAAEALRIGLISEVLPRDRLLDRALELAGQLAKGRPHAMATSKHLLRQFSSQAASMASADYFTSPGSAAEMQAGLAAFVKRRQG